MKSPARSIFRWLVAGVAVALSVPLVIPRALAFPYVERVGNHTVHSESPFSEAQRAAVLAADSKVASSPSGSFRPADQEIFLTTGGWRWRWLSIPAHNAFGLSRWYNDAIIVNYSDHEAARVSSPARPGLSRKLSSIIAHEMTHGSIRARFGMLADWSYPLELREGYCDFVAGDSTLSDSQAEYLISKGKSDPALIYWRGRKKVEAIMQRNPNVEALFLAWKG